MKVNRTGATITGSYSTDGGSWIPSVGTATPAFGSRTYIGLAVTSHDPGVTATGTFTNVTVTGFGATYGEIGTDASFQSHASCGGDLRRVCPHRCRYQSGLFPLQPLYGGGGIGQLCRDWVLVSVGLAVGRKVAATSGAFTVTGATVVVRTGYSIERPGSGVSLVTGALT